MRLTAKSEYGLLAMIDLAASGDGAPISSRALAQSRSIPQPYLEQLFAQLRRSGLVTSVRGAYGGFVLSRPAGEVTVLDIVEALEGPLTTGICDADKGETCKLNPQCVAAPVWIRATEVLRDLFTSVTLEELAADQRRTQHSESTQTKELL